MRRKSTVDLAFLSSFTQGATGFGTIDNIYAFTATIAETMDAALKGMLPIGRRGPAVIVAGEVAGVRDVVLHG